MSNPARVGMSGPLSVFAPGFLEDLIRRGYQPGTAAKQLQLMAHLSRWLGAHELEPAALDRAQIERLVSERRASHVHLASIAGVQVLLEYLRGLGVVPPAGSSEAPTPTGELLDRYAKYLRVRRGLKTGTVRGYCNQARAFLADRDRLCGGLPLESLDVAAINDYVLRESKRLSVYSTQAVALALRSLLRFLHLEGLIDRDLAVAVPTMANWRLMSLVRALDGATRRAAAGQLRSTQPDRATRLRDRAAAVAAWVADRRGRGVAAGGSRLARGGAGDQRQGRPQRSATAARRRWGGDRRLAARRATGM
jgi:integrase/recombinase XerD